jgi:metallo-beta-lactamase class B
MNEKTYSLLQKDIPYQKIVYGNQQIDGIDLDIQYFGPAHSQDNIVVFFPKYDVLFGGCIVKSLDTKSIGNIEDANVINWPIVLDKMISQYRNVSIVIPGHGEVGNFDLLTHTRDLFK